MPLSDHAVALIQGDLWAGDANADVGAPTDEGISNIDQGFDASFTTSVPPTRELFNGILRQHSALARALVTGVLNWDTRLTYPGGSLVLGSDSTVYVCQTSNAGNDPTSDDGTNWVGLLANYIQSTGTQSFKDAVTIEKSVLLKHQGSDPAAPSNANDILLYAASNILKARSTTFNRAVVLEGTDTNLGVLNLVPQAAAPANPAANNRKLYVNSSGTLFTLNSDGNAHRILVQNEVTNISPSGYIELTNRASVVSPAATKIRLFAKDKLLLYEDDGGTRTVATRSWVNTQLSSMSSTIADGSITHDKLAADAVETDNIKDGAVTGAKIAGTTIASGKLANNAVTVSKIANAAVNAAKLANNAVTTAKIQNLAVTNDKLSANAVGRDKIKNGHISNAKLENNAVTSGKIADGAVTAAKIGGGAVTHNKLATDAVESENIKDGSVTAAKLASDVMTGGGGGTIADGSITHSKLAADAVESDNIKNGNVTHAKLAADAVETDNVKNGAITNAKMASNSVVTANIANGAVTNGKISNGAVGHNKLANNAVEGENIRNGVVNSSKLGSNSVSTAKIQASAVTTAKIANNAVTTAKIPDGAITKDKLAQGVGEGGSLTRTLIAHWDSLNFLSQNWPYTIDDSTYAVGINPNSSGGRQVIPQGHSLENFIGYQFAIVDNNNTEKGVIFSNGILNSPIVWQDYAGTTLRRITILATTNNSTSSRNSYGEAIVARWTTAARTGYVVRLYLLTLG